MARCAKIEYKSFGSLHSSQRDFGTFAVKEFLVGIASWGGGRGEKNVGFFFLSLFNRTTTPKLFFNLNIVIFNSVIVYILASNSVCVCVCVYECVWQGAKLNH